jgi:hypothetical protein
MKRKIGLSDTDKGAEEAQIDLLRRASGARRFSLVRSLSASSITLSKRAIKRANPGLGQCQLDILFISFSYGEELSNRYKLFLQKRNRV